jgi:hypothetical protein
MILTVKTVTTWATDAGQITISAERANAIAQFIADGKTDGISIELSNHSWQRNWVDQAAATEFKDMLTALAALHSVPLTSIEILPLGSVIEAAPIVV